MKKNNDGGEMGNVFFQSLEGGVAREAIMSGRLNIGKGGNPVTITIKDEITEEVMEISNVRSALLMVEEVRRSSSGWISMVFGKRSKISEVLGFLSKVTLAGLEKIKK